VHCTLWLLDLGLPKMVKLLPVAHKQLRNEAFERPLTWPVIHYAYLGRLKCKISSQFCCSPSKQENMNMNTKNMEKWVAFTSH